MNKFRFTFKIMAIAIFTFAFATMAQAQATRTWVSGVGDDANPCSRTAPCKTFAGAISKTAALGEINVLDPGGFGAVTITKAITIDAGPFNGGVLTNAANAIVVNAPTTSNVTLRGLDINGLGTAADGIKVLSAKQVNVEDCVVYGFVNGIEVLTGVGISTNLVLRNVTVRNCSTNGIITTANGGSSTSIAFESVNVSNSVTGFNAQNGTRGSIRGSVFGMNATAGISTSQSGSNTEVNVDASLFTGSATGINTGSATRVRIARCLISQNANALGLGGSVDTGGNNTIMGNSANQDPNGTLFQQK
jgi:hypothetical protein